MQNTAGDSNHPSTAAHSGLSGLAHSESTSEVVARYDGWVSTYDDDLRNWGYEVPEVLARRMADALHDQTLKSPVLDAGCGTGLVGRALAAVGVGPIVGVDASADSLERAEALGVYESVAVADLLGTLDFADNTFAGVVCGGVLTYLADTAYVLEELLRVTMTGGSVIATQRTDLWVERDCEAALTALGSAAKAAGDDVAVRWSDPQPYIPGHPEYADDILVIYITIRKAG